MLPDFEESQANTLLATPKEMKELTLLNAAERKTSDIAEYTIEEASQWSETSHYSRHRDLSILCDEPSKELKLASASKKGFLIGIMWLVIMITSSATIGPLVLSLPCESVFVSTIWRTQGGFSIMFMYMIYHYFTMYSERDPKYLARKNGLSGVWCQIRNDFSPLNLGKSATMSVMMYVWNLGLIFGCKFTLTSHADVLYSSSGVFLLAFSLLTCQYVHKFEIGGYAIYAIGVAIMLTDPFAMKTGEDTNKVFGDFISFATALCGALYGILNSKYKRDISQGVFMFHFLGFIMIYQLILGSFLDGNPLYLSFDPKHGVFGWITTPSTFLYILLFIGPFTSVLSNLSLLIAYKYWTIDVVAAGFLVEPFVAQLTAILLGQDELPGLQTLLGISIISVGILVAVYGTKKKASKEASTIKVNDEESLAEMSEFN